MAAVLSPAKSRAYPPPSADIQARSDQMAQSVLVAEDERNLVEALTFLMRRAGYEVSVARDGPTTVAMAREIKPDLLLLDIMLPGFDGFDVITAIRRDNRGKQPRIILLTAKGRERDRRKAAELCV